MRAIPPTPCHEDSCRRTQPKWIVDKAICLVKAGLPRLGSINADTPTLLDFSLKMKKQNFSEDTIMRYTKALQTLERRGYNLNDSENVEQYLADARMCNGSKQQVANAVTLYYAFQNKQIQLPHFKAESKIIWIPTENELDQLISGCRHQLATFLQTLKETAGRCGEIYQAEWKDLDTVNKTFLINHPEKNSNPRAVSISDKLIQLLNTLPKQSDRIFNYKNKDILRKSYQRARKRIATNLQNPRLKQIRMHTFRHWRAQKELNKTSNVLAVMRLLGHKNLNNTQRYLGRMEIKEIEYTGAIAHNSQEALQLINAGFQFVQTIGAEHLYRKLK